jgi:hypothetical protein
MGRLYGTALWDGSMGRLYGTALWDGSMGRLYELGSWRSRDAGAANAKLRRNSVVLLDSH